MKLTDLQESWAQDCKINQTNLGAEAARTPELHAKYLNIMTQQRLQSRRAEAEYWRTRRLKYRYYRGELSREELEEQGWDQWQGAKPIKNEMDEFLQTDADLIVLQDRVEYYKTVLFQLEQILRSINSRTWDVKNSIEWVKFTSGG